jgi:hypothetical protein
MRKIGLLIGALLVSLTCHAGSTPTSADLKTAILKSTNQQTSAGGNNLSIIYGGQDFSRPVVATANESIWSGQSTHLG